MMRYRLFAVIPALAVLAISGLAAVNADPAEESYQPRADAEPEILTGEVISLCNYLAKGHRGEAYAEEGRFLVEKKQLPVGILGEDGQIYVAIMKGFQSANEKLAPLLGKQVNARGVVRRHPGANLIEVQIVSEAL